MQNRSGQFGIFSLLVLMTAAAGVFAIVRLPVDPALKMCAVFAVVVCFYGWAVRNFKYPDPRDRVAIVVGPVRRRIGLLVTLAYPVLMLAMIGSQFGLIRGLVSTPLNIIGLFFMVLMIAPIAIGVGNLIRHW
jgi:hypothetical protein